MDKMKSFWNNPENSAIKVLFVSAVVVGAGSFVYANWVNPLGGRGSVIGYGYGYTPAKVVTLPATSITSTSAVFNGNVISTGGAPVHRDFVYGLTTSYGSIVSSDFGGFPGGVGPFSSPVVTGLLCGKTYHYAAHFTNAYYVSATGGDQMFTTAPCTALPIVKADAVTSVTQTSAVINGTVVSTGGPGIVVTLHNFTTSGGVISGMVPSSTTPIASASTPFKATLSALVCATKYTYSATATNVGGTATSPFPITFTTLPCATGLDVVTVGSNSILSNHATLDGKLNALGSGATWAQVGFQYGTSPTAFGSIGLIPALRTSPGVFSLTIPTGTGLLVPHTTYYYRAYTKNSLGTVMTGAVMSFKTL